VSGKFIRLGLMDEAKSHANRTWWQIIGRIVDCTNIDRNSAEGTFGRLTMRTFQVSTLR
jgi:hypothetical protein